MNVAREDYEYRTGKVHYERRKSMHVSWTSGHSI